MIGCGSCSSRCSRRGHQRAGRVDGRRSRTGRRPGASCSCSTRGVAGLTCHPSSGSVPGAPPRDGSVPGRPPGWDRLQQRVLDELALSRCEQVLPRLLEVGICRNHSTRKLPRRVASSSWLLPARSVRMTTVSRTPFSTITDSARDHRAVPRLVRRSVEGYPGYQPGRPRANRALHVRKSTE